MITSPTTDGFLLTNLNGCDITGQIFYSQIRLHNFDTGWVVSYFSLFPLKPLLRWLLHLHAKFQPIPSSGLPCRHDRLSTFLMQKLGS